jgi:alkanesulfonate monooxygenase SsuD/methylene tetrahydromethanopterin reductase-like flavin-dependent oxidoreductase (luciferase family)
VGFGNGWIPAYLTDGELEQGIKQLHQAAVQAGRGDEKLVVGLEMFTGMGATDDSAKSTYSATLMKNFVSVEEGMKRSLVGTSKTLVQRLEAYEKAGLDFFELKFMYSTVPEFHERMKAFANDVLSSFQ